MSLTNGNNSLTEAADSGIKLWIGMQTIMLVNLFLFAYTFACLLRYGLLKEKFRWRTSTGSSIKHGGCTSYKLAFILFSLYLFSIVLTQLQMIINRATSNTFTTTTTTNLTNTTTGGYNFCQAAFTVGMCIECVLDLLIIIYMWNCQQPFYKRSAVKHLQTMTFRIFKWCNLVFMFASVVVLYVVTIQTYETEHNVRGCLLHMTYDPSVETSPLYVSMISPLASTMMLIGLYLYALYGTKRSKNQPASKGLAEAVMHRVIKRFTFYVILCFIAAVSGLIVVNVVIQNQPLYVHFVVDNLVRLVQGIAVISTMEDRRNIMLCMMT